MAVTGEKLRIIIHGMLPTRPLAVQSHDFDRRREFCVQYRSAPRRTIDSIHNGGSPHPHEYDLSGVQTPKLFETLDHYDDLRERAMDSIEA